MGGKAVETIGIDRWDLMNQTGGTTEVADWVIELDLTAAAQVLYLWMCRIAKDEDAAMGVRLTLSDQQLDRYARGDGAAAVKELMDAGAVTKVAAYKKVGKTRFEIEMYPPEVREEIGKSAHVEDLPIVSFG